MNELRLKGGQALYGHKPIKDRCIAAVSNGPRSFDWHQCYRRAEGNGQLCTQHSPDIIKAREQKAQAKYDAEMAVLRRRGRRMEDYFKLLQAAKDHCAGKLGVELLRRLVSRINRDEESGK